MQAGRVKLFALRRRQPRAACLTPRLVGLDGCLVLERDGDVVEPTQQAILRQTFPPAEQGMAMAVFSMVIMVGPAVGPVLGGYLATWFGLGSAFWIQAVLSGSAALVLFFGLDLSGADFGTAAITDSFRNEQLVRLRSVRQQPATTCGDGYQKTNPRTHG